MIKAEVLGRSGRPSYEAMTEKSGLSKETVRRLFLGIGNSEPDTIRRVADVLKVDPTVVALWNGRSRETVEAYRPPAEADLLSERQRRAVDELIRVMVNPAAAQVVPLRPDLAEASVDVAVQPMEHNELLAARRGHPEHAPDDEP